MYRLKFAKTYDFAIIQENHLKHVLEDSYSIKDGVFCVADGVTRDRLDGKATVYPQTLEEAIDLIEHYPNPSGAAIVAQICSNTFASSLANELEVSEKKILEIVKKINQEIAKINQGRKIDYIKNDYYGCVAIGGVIQDDILYCFAIGDCVIRTLDNDYNILFDTSASTIEMSLTPYRQPFLLRHIYKEKWNWNNGKCRRFYRKHVRNNPIRLMMRKYTFGVLTGQQSAISFVKTYTVPLERVKYILAYSDGCSECLKGKNAIKEVINNPEIIQKEKHEKTLIIYEKI